jgi:hypothetical protein
MFAENGPIEIAQLMAWIVGAGAALWMMARGARRRERLFAGWLAILCTLALLRELDAHLWVNPRTIGDWGMHFRTRWWLSESAPVLPRVMWLLVGLAAIGAVIAPILKVAPRVPTLLRARDGAWLLFILGAAALFSGYAFDDLIGRDQFLPKVITKAAEESCELVGAALFAAGVYLHGRLGLSMREQRALKRLGSAPAAQPQAA